MDNPVLQNEEKDLVKEDEKDGATGIEKDYKVKNDLIQTPAATHSDLASDALRALVLYTLESSQEKQESQVLETPTCEENINPAVGTEEKKKLVEATDEEDYEILLRSEEMINPVSFESSRRKLVKSRVKIRPLVLRKSPRLMSVREENEEVLDCEDSKLSEDSLMIGTSEKMVDGETDRVEEPEIFEEEERVEEQEFQIRNVDDGSDDQTELEQSPLKNGQGK